MRALPLRWRLLGVALGLIAVALALTTLVVSVLLTRYLMGQTALPAPVAPTDLPLR